MIAFLIGGVAYVGYQQIKSEVEPPIIEEEEEEEEEMTLNSELEDVFAFARKTNPLTDEYFIVGMKEDGKEILLSEIDFFTEFTYDDSKIYLYEINEVVEEGTKTRLSYIDLTKGNGNYEVIKLVDLETCSGQAKL